MMNDVKGSINIYVSPLDLYHTIINVTSKVKGVTGGRWYGFMLRAEIGCKWSLDSVQ
jgi:hypothetical protein